MIVSIENISCISSVKICSVFNIWGKTIPYFYYSFNFYFGGLGHEILKGRFLPWYFVANKIFWESTKNTNISYFMWCHVIGNVESNSFSCYQFIVKCNGIHVCYSILQNFGLFTLCYNTFSATVLSKSVNEKDPSKILDINKWVGFT